MNSTAYAVAIIGALVSIIGALIVFNLRSIKKCISSIFGRMDKQDSNIQTYKNDVQNLKVDSERRFVNSETFLRETGFTRRTLERLSTSQDRIEGKLSVVDKLPEISGNIAREIVKEMKNGDK